MDLSAVIWLRRYAEVKQMWADRSGEGQVSGRGMALIYLLPTPGPKNADEKTNKQTKTFPVSQD